jgi:hypothetical protein
MSSPMLSPSSLPSLPLLGDVLFNSRAAAAAASA